MRETNNVLWDPAGPRLEVTKRGGDPRYRYVLNIQDHYAGGTDIDWCMSRTELLLIGWWFIRRALFARQVKP